jgi:hypothetical protein
MDFHITLLSRDAADRGAALFCRKLTGLRRCRTVKDDLVHTVVETPAYLADVRATRLSEAEREAIVVLVANNPTAGDEIPGTGGARKLRIPGRGKGKSGGYRVIMFYSGEDVPVFPADALLKGREGESQQGGTQRAEEHFGGHRRHLSKRNQTQCLKSEED